MSATGESVAHGTGAAQRRRELLLLLALAALLIGAVRVAYHPRLSFSDEIVYAVIGRNIATGRGIVAGHYHPVGILEKGYPSLFVHMPGYPLLLAASFFLFGPGEAAAFVPNGVAYAATGLLLYALGAWIGGRRAALLAALLFYLCPMQLTFASTLMSEPTLVLLTTAYMALWLLAWRARRWTWGPGLAAFLAAGMLHHETFLAFLPATLALAVRLPRGERAPFLASFSACFAALLALVLWPIHLTRAQNTHYAAGILGLGEPGAILAAMGRSLWDNLGNLVMKRGGNSGTLRTQLPYLVVIGLLAAWRRFHGPARAALLFTAAGLAVTFLGLAPLYPLVKFGTRLVMHLVPGMCLLVGVLLASLRPPRVGAILGALLLAVCGYLSATDVAFMMRSQAGSRAAEAARSRVIRSYTEHLSPRSALVEDAFLYAWDAFPVAVVLFGRGLDGPGLDAVEEQLPIDVVALPGTPDSDGTGDGPPRLDGALRARGYVLLGEEEGLWVYAAERLLPVRRQSRLRPPRRPGAGAAAATVARDRGHRRQAGRGAMLLAGASAFEAA